MSEQTRKSGPGMGGDGGPVDERASDLPEGVTWEPAHGGALALRVGLYVLAIAHADGRWSAVGSLIDPNVGGTATPRPSETLLAAAQREAVAALWRVDGFGSGRVYGARVPEWTVAEVGSSAALLGLAGSWTVTAAHFVNDRLESVDAVRVNAPAPDLHDQILAIADNPPAPTEALRTLMRSAPAEPATGDAAELTRLRGALPGAIAFAREAFHNDGAEGETVWLLARTAELLDRERERLMGYLGIREAQRVFQCERADAAERHAEKAIGDGNEARSGWAKAGKDLDAARARVAELGAELADLTARHGETMAAFYSAAPDAASALGRRQVDAQSLDSTLGPEEAARLRAELTKRPARLDVAADALALTLAAEQSIRNWLRAHGHDLARPWDEVVIALLAAPPPGSVAGVLAWTKQARKDARADRGPHVKGQVAALYAAENMIRSALTPSPVDRVAAEVVASPLSDHACIPITEADDALEVIAELTAEREADTDRSLLVGVARVALEGILACDAAKGGA